MNIRNTKTRETERKKAKWGIQSARKWAKEREAEECFIHADEGGEGEGRGVYNKSKINSQIICDMVFVDLQLNDSHH